MQTPVAERIPAELPTGACTAELGQSAVPVWAEAEPAAEAEAANQAIPPPLARSLQEGAHSFERRGGPKQQ